MIKNYIKIAFRNFWRHKLFTLINIVGLSIGVSAALVIFLIVRFDFTFDKFHPDGDRIYRVVSDFTFSGQPGHNRGVCGPLPEAVRTQVTGVETSAPFFELNSPNVFIPGKGNTPVKFKNQENVVLADGRYFQLFSYKWLAGAQKSALNQPNQVVLTSEQAKKYFPALRYDQMIGKTVSYDTVRTTVTGIVQTFTQNTDFTFHDFISYSTGSIVKAFKDELRLDNWGGTTSASALFVKLSPKADAANVVKQLNTILNKNKPPKASDKGNTRSFSLQKLADIHFNEIYGTFDSGNTASKSTLYGLLVIALFLLLLGCINFINLTTAQAAQRAKEIGIRKTMGSTRLQLIIQFLSETFFITLFAVMISVLVAPVILKLFADFIAPGIKADYFNQPALLLFLLILTLVVSALSGFYPAVVLSGYKPVSVLKTQGQGSSQTRNAWLRKSLTVTQFVIAQFFIIATVLVSKQIYYALHKDLGFKKEAILIINTPWKNRTADRNLVFINELRKLPQVEMVSAGRDAPASTNDNSTEATYKDGKKEIKTEVHLKFGDENYIKVFKIKLLAGRNLRPGDSSKAFLINANYAKLLGFKNPQEAVGKYIDNYNGDKRMEIIGVVADFHQGSLHEPINPMIISTRNDYYFNGTFSIALKPETPGGEEWKKAIAAIQTTWKTLYPDDDFEYKFFDESIAKFYTTEQHTATLLAWATGLSVFISCLGLLGLAIYTTSQRTKEIGVRKVLGASVIKIVTLLSTELILLILIAFVVVTPIAWYAMNKWMQSFADRTTISWWIFLLSGGVMLLAAVLTSSFQTIKAATANPVKSLRSE